MMSLFPALEVNELSTLVTVLSIFGLVSTISGNILINYRRKIGFLVWIIGNILWILVNVFGTFNLYMVIMYVLYAILNVDGWIKWGKIQKKTS